MNKKLILWSLTIALGGFLFGLDTAVISGAEQTIQKLWNLSNTMHGFAISIALYGTVIGAMFGGVIADAIGRKKSSFWVGLLFFISAAGSALAPDVYTFMVMRFIGGLCIGASSVVSPLYIAEIAPPNKRGFLVALFQFNIVFGILIAFVSNYLLQGFNDNNDWRWMLGVLAIPSAVYTLLVMGVPESPRWLITRKNDLETAKRTLEQIGTPDTDKEIRDIIDANAAIETMGSTAGFFSKKYKVVLLLAFLLAFFNQLSGINFILYYAPEILESAGIASKDSLFNSIAIGGTNLIFTFAGLYLIDRIGRKQLLIIGSIGYIISLAAVAWSFYTHAGDLVLMSSLLLFIASHAIGQGAVIWVFISEIFPNKIRALGQSFGCSVHWVFAALITLITPVFLDGKTGIFKDNPWPIFAFFSGMMILQLIWVLTKVPETKAVSLEELEKKLIPH